MNEEVLVELVAEAAAGPVAGVVDRGLSSSEDELVAVELEVAVALTPAGTRTGTLWLRAGLLVRPMTAGTRAAPAAVATIAKRRMRRSLRWWTSIALHVG
ncbi:hypothetical protein [Kineococcus radiotolerans]|uniref:hypothetical protein n=1 Tax=Kineococcus radiotolerans TaxID=131568 RepID=UPI00059E5FBD|nr:hypothetical protein [Kineococcus radiotolerans]